MAVGRSRAHLVAAFLGTIMLSAAPAAAQPVLNNAATEVGISAKHSPDHITLGFTNAIMQPGVAVGDFNRSGYPDIFVPIGGQAPDVLYINNGDGTFTDQAARWGIAFQQGSVGAAVADINSNGWLDIYLTCYGPSGQGGQPGNHRLYRNNGDETFTDIAAQAGVNYTTTDIANGFGSAFGDYNLNGHLDLFVCSWKDSAGDNFGTGNRLFRNNGDETFTDVTEEAIGFNELFGVWGFQPAFVDMDNSGFPDLLIAADFGTSRYFINNGDGTFTNFTEPSGTGLDSHGMGQTVGDVNNSGLLDWYVTSIYSNNLTAGIGSHNGNALYLNQGDHIYIENSQEAGVDDGAWGWAALAIDLENNGWLDLIEVNGRPGSPWANEPGRLFRNDADGTFTEMAMEAGFDHVGEGRGLAWLDADRDGRLDFIVSVYNNDLLFYRNETPDAGNWLALTFNTSNNPLIPPDGIGVHVTAVVGEQSYVQYLSGSPSYLGTSELAVHFGLADAKIVDEILIRWPRGYETTLTDVDVNQRIEVTSPNIADLNGSGSVGVADLLILISEWGSCETVCLPDLNNDGSVGIPDLLILINNWG